MESTESRQFIYKKHLYYQNTNGKTTTYKPWLGDLFAFMYDRIMEKSVFPKKFKGDMKKHMQILKEEFKSVHNENILEVATGSGNAVYFLNPDNDYTGTDISTGLLRQAYKNFRKHKFPNVRLYVAEAAHLPFAKNSFDRVICNLSLNFFPEIEPFLNELQRVLKPGGIFFCSVPIPEKTDPKAKIHGKLYTTEEIKRHLKQSHFNFHKKDPENGALKNMKPVFSPMYSAGAETLAWNLST